MRFVKKNKYTIIVIVIFAIFIVIGFKIKDLLVPDSGKAIYGDRLDNASEHKVSESQLKEICDELKKSEEVVNATYYLHGSIINFIITVKNEESVDKAKELAKSTLTYFVDNELKYYSLQVYLKKDDSSLNNFPIIGYKDTGSEALLFTKDREITAEESNEE